MWRRLVADRWLTLRRVVRRSWRRLLVPGMWLRLVAVWLRLVAAGWRRLVVVWLRRVLVGLLLRRRTWLLWCVVLRRRTWLWCVVLRGVVRLAAARGCWRGAVGGC